jgi:hypothetical protein
MMPHYRSRNNGVSQSWTVTCEIINQSESLLFFNLFLSGICHSDEKQTVEEWKTEIHSKIKRTTITSINLIAL